MRKLHALIGGVALTALAVGILVGVWGSKATSTSTGQMSSGSSAAGTGKILYYRNPMGLPDTSPTPKKDSMGMDYIAVYAGEESADDGRRFGARRVWIVDPVDSTSDFAAGGDEWCVSIGLLVEGEAAAELLAHFVHAAPGEMRVRPRKVDVLEDAALGLRRGEALGAQATLVDRDQLAGLEHAQAVVSAQRVRRCRRPKPPCPPHNPRCSAP